MVSRKEVLEFFGGTGYLGFGFTGGKSTLTTLVGSIWRRRTGR